MVKLIYKIARGNYWKTFWNCYILVGWLQGGIKFQINIKAHHKSDFDKNIRWKNDLSYISKVLQIFVKT